MKYLLVAIAIFTSTTPAFADCKECKALTSLSQKLSSLKFADAEELIKGQDAIREGIKFFSELKNSKKEKAQLFEAMMVFTKEAGPFDAESEAASGFAEQLKANPELKVSLQKFLAKSDKGSYCKQELFKRNVAIQECHLAAGAKGQDSANGKQAERLSKCAKPFNYENCLKTKS